MISQKKNESKSNMQLFKENAVTISKKVWPGLFVLGAMFTGAGVSEVSYTNIGIGAVILGAGMHGFSKCFKSAKSFKSPKPNI